VRISVAVLACAAVFAPCARAATVSLVDAGEAAPGRFAVSYRAGAGEANRLTARETVPGRAWSFGDAGAPVVPGPNCAAGAGGAVTCTAPAPTQDPGPPPLNTVVIDLGDRDDRARISGSRYGGTEVDAGLGDDDLLVTAGWVRALMGPGDDRARGAGDDLMGGGLRRGGLSVSGGEGADTISSAGRADVSALYFGAPAGVRVRFDDRPNDGVPGEDDNVRSGVRTLYGSAHADLLDAGGVRHAVTIYGEAGDDVVRGGLGRDGLGGDGGDDRLFGAAGDDALSGGAGRNVVAGGRGHDRYFVDSDARDVIRARGGGADDVFCEKLPRVLEADARDRLTRCAFPIEVLEPPRLDRRRRLHLALACPALAPGGCRATLRLIDTRPAPLAETRVKIGAGRHTRLSIRLGHRPRNLLLTAIFANHRARPPDSVRTTVAAFALCPHQPADGPGIMDAPCPPPSPAARSSTPAFSAPCPCAGRGRRGSTRL
jgi:hypothetical protein